jgi:hypothetical protein
MPYNALTGRWTAPPPEVHNYTLVPNTNVAGWASLANTYWDDVETMAWHCNQNPICTGYIYWKGSNTGLGGWFTQGNEMDVSHRSANSGVDLYIKISNSYPSSQNPDTTDPSILPTSETATQIKLGTVSPQGPWTGSISAPGGWGSAGSRNFNWNYGAGISYYQIPLGWKWAFYTNRWEGPWGAKNREYYRDNPNPGQYGINNPVNHGMEQYEGIGHATVQNIGFDVLTNWTTMSNQYIDPTDELKIKKRWCQLQSPSVLVANSDKCQGTTSTGSVIFTPVDYDTVLVAALQRDTANSWASQPAVIAEMKRIIQGNLNGANTQALLAMFTTWCTAHPTDAKCACINASKYGFTGTSNCFTTGNSLYPGCATYSVTTAAQGTLNEIGIVPLLKPIFDLPKNLTGEAINSLGASRPGCLVGACTLAAGSGDDYTFPYTTVACQPAPVQICGITIDVGAAQNSPIAATCNQTQVINTPGSSPSSSPSASPSGSSASSSSTSSSTSSTNKKVVIGGGIACVICVFMILIIVVLLISD